MKRAALIALLAAPVSLGFGFMFPSFGPPLFGASLLATLVVIRGVVCLSSGLFCSATTSAHGLYPEVALTFDDGPDEAPTNLLLDFLRDEGIRAAFFVIGERVEVLSDTVARAMREGHLVENHSHTHSIGHNFLFTAAMTRELVRCNQSVLTATGRQPRYYRPPFGLANHATEAAAAAAGLRIVGWSVRGLDTSGCRPESVVKRVLSRVRPGSIVLLHDGGRDPAKLVAITRSLVEGLKALGLRPVRLDRLLDRGRESV